MKRRFTFLLFLPLLLNLTLPPQLIAYPTSHLRQTATFGGDGARKLIRELQGTNLTSQDGNGRMVDVGQFVQAEILGPLMTVRINRPEALNSVSPQLLEELNKALTAAENDPEVKVVVLTGAGERAFIAGADVSVFDGINQEKMRAFTDQGQALTNRIDAFSKPVIAAINGYALGGGLEIAMATRYRIAVKSAKVGLPEITLGLIPGWGGTQRAPRLVGPEKALSMMINATYLSAEEAKAIGLVDEVVEDHAALLARAQELAATPDQIPAPRNWDEMGKSQNAEIERLLESNIISALGKGIVPQGFEMPQGQKQVVLDRADVARRIWMVVSGGYSSNFQRGLTTEAQVISTLIEREPAQRGIEAFRKKERPPQIVLFSPTMGPPDGGKRAGDGGVKRVAVNGAGAIGRVLLRAWQENPRDLEIVAMNDVAFNFKKHGSKGVENLVWLLKNEFQTKPRSKVQDARFAWGKDADETYWISINDHRIIVTDEPDPTKLPWGKLNVDVVFEATGRFTKAEDAKKHREAGAKHVIVTAPATGELYTVAPGVTVFSQEDIEGGLGSCASCTTNAIASPLKVLHKAFGIEKGDMTTIHAVTNDQATLDILRPEEILRGRAAFANMIPTKTGAAAAIGKVIPELEGKLQGWAIRVPVVDGSVAIIEVVVSKPTTKEEVNRALKEAAESSEGTLSYETDPIVSSDILGRTEASIIDSTRTEVIGGNLVRVIAWYDNERGYVERLLAHVSEINLPAAADGAGKFAENVQELFQSVSGVLEITPTEVRVLDEEKLRTQLVYDLVDNARFNEDPQVKAAAQRFLRETGLALGIKEASIHPFYMARHEKDAWSNITVPAYNMRNGFENMLPLFRVMIQDNGIFILELAKSELRYTGQRPDEYNAMGYAAAIANGYRGPLFFQSDHYQLDAKVYAKDPQKAIGDLEKQIREDVLAGRRNIDVDPSTLVNEEALDKIREFERMITTRFIEFRSGKGGVTDMEFEGMITNMGGLKGDAEEESDGIWALRRKLVDDLEVGLEIPEYRDTLTEKEKLFLEQYGLSDEEKEQIRSLYQEMHKTTFDVTMHFIRFIRGLEKELGINTPISIGVEERHIDNPKHKKYPSTVLGSITLMRQVIDRTNQEGLVQPSKLALQTGTMHGLGGKVDWGIFERHQLARKAIGVSVFVQHGTSTLPQEEFANMPKSGAGEAHLATEYQKITLGLVAAHVPELREKMAAYLEALVYPDKEITDPDIEARLKEAKLFDKEKRQKDFVEKFLAKWEKALAQEGKTRDQILVEILGDALEGKLKGSLKDHVKELSGPFKYEVAKVAPEVAQEIDQTLAKEYHRINVAQNVVNTQPLLDSLLNLEAQNVVLPPRPFETATFAQKPEATPGEVDTTGEDGGRKQSFAESYAQLGRELSVVPLGLRWTRTDLTKRFLSGRLPEDGASLLDYLEIHHPLLSTQLIAVTMQRERFLGAAKGVTDKTERKRIKDSGDLRAQEVQDLVARHTGHRLVHVLFESKGEIAGAHEAGAESGDLQGARTPTVSDVIELTDAFVDGTPGASSIQIEGPAAEYFGAFPDEARAFMVTTHIKPKFVEKVLKEEDIDPSEPQALEKFLYPRLDVNILVERIAALNGVTPNEVDVTLLTADESDMKALQTIKDFYPSLQIDRVSGGTVQPAFAAALGVDDGRVRAFIRRSGMTEAVIKTLFASAFTADGALSLFTVVSPEVKKGNDQWNNWPADVAEKMSKRPDWGSILAGNKIFSSREITSQPVRGAYTFLTDGRTDKELPFDVKGVRDDGGSYLVNTLLFATNPLTPGEGYLELVKGRYDTSAALRIALPISIPILPLGPSSVLLQSQEGGTIPVYEEALDNLTIAYQIEMLAKQLKNSGSKIGFSLISTSGNSESEIVQEVLKDSAGTVNLQDLFQVTLTKDQVDVSKPQEVVKALNAHGLPLLELVAPEDVVLAYREAKIQLYAWLVSENPKEGEEGIADGAHSLRMMTRLLELPQEKRDARLLEGGLQFTVTILRYGQEVEDFDKFYRVNRGS